MKYLVIEVCEREISSIAACDTGEEAIATANDMLKRHMEEIGCSKEYESNEDKYDEWEPAATDNRGAWCNYHQKWDAFITQFP